MEQTINRNDITAWKLQQYMRYDEKDRTAILNLGERIFDRRDIITITLDDEDVQHLLRKYKISKIREKEIELQMTISTLSKIEKELRELKQ